MLKLNIAFIVCFVVLLARAIFQVTKGKIPASAELVCRTYNKYCG